MEKFPCPVCGDPIETAVFQCKDHSVSGEFFDICLCKNCLFATTRPQPSLADIAKYYETEEYISHSDTDKGLVNKLYHIIRTKNINKKIQLINNLSSQKGHLLDVGCGTGYFLAECQRENRKIDGVEVSDSARAAAETRTGIKIYPSIDDLEKTGKKFDIITLWHVFEHLHDINASLEQLKRLLNPSGTLILALPNHQSGDAGHYKKYWAAYDVPRHLSHFSPKSIHLFAEKHGLKVQTVQPMTFDAYYVSMLSEGLKGAGKLMSLVKGLFFGYLSNCKARKTKNYSSLIYVLKVEAEN